ncbi:TOBE domain-containing protein [Rhodoblastus sp.]|jgi:molybdopterin-binding protein|uniref:TOBE domain-containing protein n=1 Tax=Rhodoblastus sp. TaxID=1962975 RepID=UPI00262742B9|nr:TOBE domain-containing protein [Rhodoblastus sp.]
MKISARNVFEGKIIDIKKGATTSHVVIDVKGLHITASITNEAVDELALKVGQTASAVIKASEVLVAIP